MKDYIFIDSNIWIYAFLPENKAGYTRLVHFLKRSFKENLVVVSFQVINEVCFNLKKNGFSEDKISKIIRSFERKCIIVDFSFDILLRAADLRKKHAFSYWDSLIVASALFSQSKILFSEDMQDGRIIEGLSIKNPMKSR